MSEEDKAITEALLYGTGVTMVGQDGVKHIPLEEVLKPDQLYCIEYAPNIDDPLPGMMAVPDTLLLEALETIKGGEWAYYDLYKISVDDLKNNTKGEFVERWIRP